MTDTETEIPADLVRDLSAEQHPDLAGLAVREGADGWGNQMGRLGDELAVPTPRMPLPVPTPVRFGEPSERFPSTGPQ